MGMCRLCMTFTLKEIEGSTFIPFEHFFVCVFLGPNLRHMEVPRLGVKSELQLPAYTTATAILDLSLTLTYTAAHGNARSLTH